jgi:BirA family biotin operon repressor/biotin-[acetyl-CoA-carboxylase] ligase
MVNALLNPIRWPSEAIWEAVYPSLANFSVEVIAELDSSNTELIRRARSGQTGPVVLVDESQSAGRGRLGRQWLSGRGDSLTFSLGLPLPVKDWSGLSLAVGLPALATKWRSLDFQTLPLSRLLQLRQ